MAENDLTEVVQRWQRTPEGEFKEEDRELFINAGRTIVAQGDGGKLLDFFREQRNQGIVKSMGCGLMAPLVDEALKRRKSLVDCRAAIHHLVQTCRPADLQDVLLEQVKSHPEAISDTIMLLVPALQTALLRLGDRKGPSVGATLEVLQTQVAKLPVPYTPRQEREDAYGLGRCCGALLDFVRPFVAEVQGSNATADGSCMLSLRDPLLQAHLDGPQSSLWNFATQITIILPAIQHPLPKLLLCPTPRKMEQSGDRGESRACLAYLLFVQLIAMEMFPAVFSPVFVLQCNMDYINLLLSSKEEPWLMKGLELYEKSLERVEDGSLPVALLELQSFSRVPQNLVEIMTVCPMEHLKTKGLAVFQLFTDKLSGEAKHKFFRCMLKTSHHAGVDGHIIKNIKKQVDLTRKAAGSVWFSGSHLLSLLQLALCLPQGAETDLLNGMDRVIESLNLLRFLLIVQKGHGSIVDASELHALAERYLKTLRACLCMSRSYYSSEVKGIREDHKNKAKEAREAQRGKNPARDITVKNEKLSSMSPEVQHQVLQSALVTFDLMESLVVRIEELMEGSCTPEI
ncbi:glomulin, FKBP associated protein b isoform X2 [Denticeps clupeoides]|uniref:glomulin, FKBP associated protein b isoform X2 n=1 Tax=Denticeps clupeoides TaxID=299321 RepID=UPI0010A4DCE0|nr:glomulin-like isoform X2 [Denticeps clupeoides]